LLLSSAALFNAATADDTPTIETISGVNLRAAGNYAILAKSGISTVPDSSVTIHIAVSPIEAAAITVSRVQGGWCHRGGTFLRTDAAARFSL
jgi:ABC-type Na+ efflux pump permease subunit